MIKSNNSIALDMDSLIQKKLELNKTAKKNKVKCCSKCGESCKCDKDCPCNSSCSSDCSNCYDMSKKSYQEIFNFILKTSEKVDNLGFDKIATELLKASSNLDSELQEKNKDLNFARTRRPKATEDAKKTEKAAKKAEEEAKKAEEEAKKAAEEAARAADAAAEEAAKEARRASEEANARRRRLMSGIAEIPSQTEKKTEPASPEVVVTKIPYSGPAVGAKKSKPRKTSDKPSNVQRTTDPSTGETVVTVPSISKQPSAVRTPKNKSKSLQEKPKENKRTKEDLELERRTLEDFEGFEGEREYDESIELFKKKPILEGMTFRDLESRESLEDIIDDNGKRKGEGKRKPKSSEEYKEALELQMMGDVELKRINRKIENLRSATGIDPKEKKEQLEELEKLKNSTIEKKKKEIEEKIEKYKKEQSKEEPKKEAPLASTTRSRSQENWRYISPQEYKNKLITELMEGLLKKKNKIRELKSKIRLAPEGTNNTEEKKQLEELEKSYENDVENGQKEINEKVEKYIKFFKRQLEKREEAAKSKVNHLISPIIEGIQRLSRENLDEGIVEINKELAKAGGSSSVGSMVQSINNLLNYEHNLRREREISKRINRILAIEKAELIHLENQFDLFEKEQGSKIKQLKKDKSISNKDKKNKREQLMAEADAERAFLSDKQKEFNEMFQMLRKELLKLPVEELHPGQQPTIPNSISYQKAYNMFKKDYGHWWSYEKFKERLNSYFSNLSYDDIKEFYESIVINKEFPLSKQTEFINYLKPAASAPTLPSELVPSLELDRTLTDTEAMREMESMRAAKLRAKLLKIENPTEEEKAEAERLSKVIMGNKQRQLAEDLKKQKEEAVVGDRQALLNKYILDKRDSMIEEKIINFVPKLIRAFEQKYFPVTIEQEEQIIEFLSIKVDRSSQEVISAVFNDEITDELLRLVYIKLTNEYPVEDKKTDYKKILKEYLFENKEILSYFRRLKSKYSLSEVQIINNVVESLTDEEVKLSLVDVKLDVDIARKKWRKLFILRTPIPLFLKSKIDEEVKRNLSQPAQYIPDTARLSLTKFEKKTHTQLKDAIKKSNLVRSLIAQLSQGKMIDSNRIIDDVFNAASETEIEELFDTVEEGFLSIPAWLEEAITDKINAELIEVDYRAQEAAKTKEYKEALKQSILNSEKVENFFNNLKSTRYNIEINEVSKVNIVNAVVENMSKFLLDDLSKHLNLQEYVLNVIPFYLMRALAEEAANHFRIDKKIINQEFTFLFNRNINKLPEVNKTSSSFDKMLRSLEEKINNLYAFAMVK
jgi:hypothetical protein